MSMQSTEQFSPVQYQRRSQLYRRHIATGAAFKAVANILTVDAYSKTIEEVQKASHLGLADLSTHPRLGFKGSGALSWLNQQKLQLPENPNQAVQQAKGSLIARLSQEEFLILNDLDMASLTAEKLEARYSLDSTDGVYLLPRNDSHCWLALTGIQAPDCLAKLCGIDMRVDKFANGEIAQTSLARVNAIILRYDLGVTPCFYILSDVSLTEFLWDGLLDSMQEFQGVPIGISALKKLSQDI